MSGDGEMLMQINLSRYQYTVSYNFAVRPWRPGFVPDRQAHVLENSGRRKTGANLFQPTPLMMTGVSISSCKGIGYGELSYGKVLP